MPKEELTIPLDYVYPESRFTRYEGPLQIAPDNDGNDLPDLLSLPETGAGDRVDSGIEPHQCADRIASVVSFSLDVERAKDWNSVKTTNFETEEQDL